MGDSGLVQQETHSALHSVSVAAVIVRKDGKVLAIRRRDTREWQPPGGVLERHEAIEEALIREVKEEAGVLVKHLVLTGVYKHVQRGILALVYRCRIQRRVCSNWHETADARWMTRGEVIQHMDRVFAARVLDALDYRNTPAVRLHNGSAFVSSTQFWMARRLRTGQACEHDVHGPHIRCGTSYRLRSAASSERLKVGGKARVHGSR